MKRIVLFVSILSAAAAWGAGPMAPAGRPGGNLCYNGSFDVPEKPLDGWTYDYQWEGNSHYMQNHTRVSAVPQYDGKQKVMFINGSAETKVESRPIPFEVGKRYRCELSVKGNTMPHIYFRGYKWQPGIRPYTGAVHIGDIRMIYKSEFRNHQVTPVGGGWKKVAFEFPLKDLSELAMKHLKYVRFITVFIVVVDTEKGQVYVDDVVVRELP